MAMFLCLKSGNAFKTTGEVSEIDDFNVMLLAFPWVFHGFALAMRSP